MNTTTRIRSNIDFDLKGAGKQQGFLQLPHSTHASAYGWIPIPIVIINGADEGPSVLLMAGNHGDEYEGQLALTKLCRELQPDAVRGRLIILPMANFPAAQAGLRTSPIDGGNLNRSFPGHPDGTPTAAIAHYIEAVLLPKVEVVIDFSGGSSLDYIPSTFTARPTEPEQLDRVLELLRQFAAPLSCIGDFPGEDRTLIAAARRAGVIAIGTELGGGGRVTPAALRVAENGVYRVLLHLGSLSTLASERAIMPAPPTRMVMLGGTDYFVFSPDAGLWEPLVDLGDEVEARQPAAVVHCPETPWREPVTVCFSHAGTVVCRRISGRTVRGDCLYHLVTDWSSSK